jgi:hypothetical protein
MQRTCRVTGQQFEVSEQEMTLRKKLGVAGEPDLHPVYRLMELGAFWQHWNLFRRPCDRTGKPIISVYADDCPYPVWHKDEWVKHADPPSSVPDLMSPVFPQMWELFRRCPIAHNVGTGNENCEYTDDWWYSKNCYLCHSGLENEDLRYCYRVVHLRNSQYCVFCSDSELSRDLVSCHNCFRVLFGFNCWQCSDSAFLYDCRNCSNCLFCTNLRSKSYCIDNVQLTEEEYKRQSTLWDLRSRETYDWAKQRFMELLQTRAWHRALQNEHSENVTGNYLDECKDCTDCFFLTNKAQDCVNAIRGGADSKDCLDVYGPAIETELTYYSSNAQDRCYKVSFGYNSTQCKYCDYCAHCFQCEHCFGCCGLMKKKYCIFNTPYSPEEYERLKRSLIDAMKRAGEYGRFFPGYFSACPYNESFSGYYWPLDEATSTEYGFRTSQRRSEKPNDALDVNAIPDRSDQAKEVISKSVFWDRESGHPFRIDTADITFAKTLGCPLPHCYYAHRLQENFRLIPFNGMLRPTKCEKCSGEIQISWPEEYDGRILCEECYLKEVY